MASRKEEIVAAMAGETSLVPPAVFMQSATVGQMDSCGYGWPEANTDPEMMAALSLELSRRFGIATARVPFCMTVEPDTLGCTSDEGTRDRQPSVIGSPWRSTDGGIPDVPDMPSPSEFAHSGRCARVLESLEIIAEEEVYSLGMILDPITLTCQTIGMEGFLIGLMVEPEKTEAWVSALAPLSCAYAEAMGEVADCVCMLCEGESDILPPDMFDRYVGRYTPKVVSSAKTATVIHCCGDSSEVLEKLAGLGETALSVESRGDPEGIISRVGSKVRLAGGVDPLATLYGGSPDSVVSEARATAEAGFALVTPECGIPPHTPDENIAALADYREWS